MLITLARTCFGSSSNVFASCLMFLCPFTAFSYLLRTLWGSTKELNCFIAFRLSVSVMSWVGTRTLTLANNEFLISQEATSLFNIS